MPSSKVIFQVHMVVWAVHWLSVLTATARGILGSCDWAAHRQGVTWSTDFVIVRLSWLLLLLSRLRRSLWRHFIDAMWGWRWRSARSFFLKFWIRISSQGWEVRAEEGLVASAAAAALATLAVTVQGHCWNWRQELADVIKKKKMFWRIFQT